jgi:ATP-binding cassette subfamily C protein CydC
MKELWRLLKLFSPYKLWILGGIMVSLASTLASITLMAVSGWFITAMGIAGVTGAAINYFTPAAIIRACAIIRTGGRYGERLITHEATFRIIAQLRRWFYDHLEPLAPAVLSKERSGDIFSRLRGDIDVLERFYLNFLVPASVGALASIIITAVVYSYHSYLALIIGVMLVVTGVFLPFFVYMLGKKYEEAVVDINAKMRTEMATTLQGMGELLVYDINGKYCIEDEMKYAYIQKAQNQLKSLDLFAQNAAFLCVNVAMLVVVICAALLAQGGELTWPDVVMLALLTLASYEAVQPLVSATRSLGGVMRAAKRIFDITDKKALIHDVGETVIDKDRSFSLAFDKVCFGYDPIVPVFRDLSFEVKAGEKVLVIGPSGAGKSSIINLALRFWEPQSGRITLCGNDICAYKGEHAREHFSVVTQSPHLFEATLRGNLLIAKPKAEQNELDLVCEWAGLSEMIAALPKGYDTYIGENGRQLSGGEMKRLALAQALLKDAPCLILDEPGEGLDYEMERDILTRVIDHRGDAALIYVTHRRGVSDLFDKIVTLRA